LRRYVVERGDVLLSLQLILTREAERVRPRVVPAHARVERPRPSIVRAAAPAAPTVAPIPKPRLRGDLMLERCWPPATGRDDESPEAIPA
jgi:hypothetical protein